MKWTFLDRLLKYLGVTSNSPGRVVCLACKKETHPDWRGQRPITCVGCRCSDSDAAQDAAQIAKDSRPETLVEYWDRLKAEGFPYAHLSDGELFTLEKSGDKEATRELKRRDDIYSQLGQG